MTNKKEQPQKITAAVKPVVKDNSSNPFIEQKIANSKKVIAKYGIPQELLTGKSK